MSYGVPSDPVGGTVITVAYAVSNLLDPIRWLRLLTGNADPPGASYVVVSSSTTGTSWSRIPTDAYADGSITTVKIAALAITDALIAAVNGSKIVDNTVNGDTKLASSTITGNSGSSAIGTGVIHGNRMIANTFDTTQVAHAFATGAFDATNIADIFADGAINGDAKLGDSTVTGNSAGSAIGADVIHANRLVGASMSDAEALRIFGRSVPHIASGSYVGTGATTARQIATGFVTKIAFAYANNGSGVDTLFVFLTTSVGMQMSSGPLVQGSSAVHLHASDGFVVSDGTANGNVSGLTYTWIAFG